MDAPAPRGMRFKDLRRNLRYYLGALPAIAVLSRLPLPLARRLGRAVGLIGWLLIAKSRRRAMENLTQTFPEKSRREVSRICRGVFRNLGENVCELLVIHRFTPERIRQTFPLEEDFRELNRLYPEGVVGITGHFGNWELLGVLFGVYLPGRSAPVAKRIYFEKFQELVERFRLKAGVEVIYTDASPRRMIEALHRGKILGMLPDQNLKAVSGVFVDFFGRPAYTSTAPVHLALATRVPVFCCYLVRDGGRYRVLLHDVPLQRTGRREDDLLENTRRWTRIMEEDVRIYPDQWAWFHRRWKRRPEEGPRTVGRRRKREASAVAGAAVPAEVGGEEGRSAVHSAPPPPAAEA